MREKSVRAVWKIASVIGVCCFFLCRGSVLAEGNIHVGQLQLHPYVEVSETFSDNIYYTSVAEKRDDIVTYLPGIKLQLPLGRFRAEAQYYAVLDRHKIYHGEDTTDHHADGLAEYTIGSRFTVRVSDVFDKGHEGRSSSSTGFVEVYRNNTATASASYQFAGRTKIQFDAGKSTWDFAQSPFRDRDEDLFSGYIYYRFLPKTSVFLEFDRKNVTFDDPTLRLDNIANYEMIGIMWEATEKSRGTIKTGRMQKDFDSPSQKDYDSWTGSIDVRHEFSEYTSLQLIGQRTLNEANVLGTRYMITTGGSGEFTHYIVRKLAVVVRGAYGVDDFSNAITGQTKPREDKTSFGGGGLKYSIGSRLEIDADFRYRSRHSNVATAEYREHAYILTAKLAL